MKGLGLILTVTMIICAIVGVGIVTHGYTAAHESAWQMDSTARALANAQLYQVEAQEAARRAIWFTEFYRFLFVVIVCVAVMGTAVYYWKVYDQRKESWARAVDGSFALQSFSNGNVKWSIDPNKIATGTTGFQVATGALGEFSSAAGADRQLAYNLSVQKTRTTSAMMTGDSGPRYAAHAKLLAGAYDRNEVPQLSMMTDEPDPVATWQPLTLADAFAQSRPNHWLIGQNDQGICEFNIGSVVHAAVLGSSNSGKTSSTALLMAANARKQGISVIALDAANGIDWNPYADTFEVYETDYRVIGDQLNQIIKIHDQRKKACVLGGVKTIYQLDYTMPPMMVVLEEFGRLMQSFKIADPDGYENIVVALTVLMSDSRKSGISFLFIDQGMQVWDKRFKTNIRDYIAYRMNAKQGSGFDAYGLHKLKPQGQFWNNGEIYNAWHTAPQFYLLQKELRPQRVKLLTDVQYSVVDDNRNTSIVNRGISEGDFRELDTPIPSTSTQQNNADTLVNDTGTLLSSTGTQNNDTGTQKPALTGKPITRKDKELVKNVYALEGSINKTCMVVYGGLSPTRKAWISEVLRQSAVLQ